MSRIRWLQLSDLHISKENVKDISKVLEALWQDLQRLADEGHTPDFICFTGDIAWAGKPEQYCLAEKVFLRPLLYKTRLTKEHLVWIPGNHDVDWGIVKDDAFVENGVQVRLTTRSEVNKALDDADQRTLLFRRLDPYAEFTQSYFGNLLGTQDAHYCTARVLNIGGTKVGISCLNSAWRCTGKDESRLLIGERQIDEASERIQHTDVKIALMHHPFHMLHQCDANDAKNLCLKTFDFVLRGHYHEPKIELTETPLGEALILPVAAIYQGRQFEGYSLIDCDPTTKDGRVILRRYVDSRREFDSDIMSAREGKFLFKLTPAPTRMPITVPLEEHPGEPVGRTLIQAFFDKDLLATDIKQELETSVISGEEIDQKFLYWDVDATRRWIDLCKTAEYELHYLSKNLLIDSKHEICDTILRDSGRKVFDFVDLGVGSGEKDYHILDVLLEKAGSSRLNYYAIDLSFPIIQETLKYLGTLIGRNININYIIGDILRLGRYAEILRQSKNPKLLGFLGGSLGNFKEGKVLSVIRDFMELNDYLLLGVEYIAGRSDADLKKGLEENEQFRDFIMGPLIYVGIEKLVRAFRIEVTEGYSEVPHCKTVLPIYSFGGREIRLGRSTKYDKELLSQYLIDEGFVIVKEFNTTDGRLGKLLLRKQFSRSEI